MTTTIARDVTDWYPADVWPARQGVYQLWNTSTDAVFYARWLIKTVKIDDLTTFVEGWTRGHFSVQFAAVDDSFGVVQDKWQWRGLRSPA